MAGVICPLDLLQFTQSPKSSGHRAPTSPNGTNTEANCMLTADVPRRKIPGLSILQEKSFATRARLLQ